jgi:outer membrane protein
MKSRMLAVLALALAPATAAAQADVPQTLRLEDALRIARTNNPEYLKILNDEDVAASNIRRAWGQLLPSVNTNMSWNLNASTRVTGENDFGEPVRLDDPVTFRSSSANQGINMGVTLFDGGQNLRELSLARAEATSADARIASQQSLLASNVTRAFYDAVQSLRLVQVEERNLAAAQDRMERTEAQFEIATANQVDMLGARRSVLEAQRQLSTQRANAEKRRFLLTSQMGVEPATPFDLDTSVPEVFDPSTLDDDALVERARGVHPRLREAEAAVATARARSSTARGTRWPTIDASFGFSRSTSRSGFEAFGEVNPLNRGWGGGVSLRLPVFSGFNTSHQIEVAETAERDALQDQRRMQLLVEQEIRSALVDLRNAYEALQLATQIAQITEERLVMAEEQYRNAALDFLQLQQLIDDNLNAQRLAVDAQFTFITARATLEEKLGGPIRQ